MVLWVCRASSRGNLDRRCPNLLELSCRAMLSRRVLGGCVGNARDSEHDCRARQQPVRKTGLAGASRSFATVCGVLIMPQSRSRVERCSRWVTPLAGGCPWRARASQVAWELVCRPCRRRHDRHSFLDRSWLVFWPLVPSVGSGAAAQPRNALMSDRLLRHAPHARSVAWVASDSRAC
jgi:hypothetical protein